MKGKRLDVPYLSQLDNRQNPYGSCNVTACAMVLKYFGIKGTGDGQLEDQLYGWLQRRGMSRHSPYDLAELIAQVGATQRVSSDFRPDAKWSDASKWIDAGNPLIAHGYFTKFGHIITVIGYSERGWIVHDPYGEWYPSGYDTSASGEGLTYSYGMMRRLCGDDGDLWLHFVGRSPKPLKNKG
jgi:hypothetical protein